jgi:hypothetical protein
MPSFSELFAPVPARIPRTAEIDTLISLVNGSTASLSKLQLERDLLKAKLQTVRATGEISGTDIQMLRLLDVQCSEQEKRLCLLSLDLDLEQICVCLLQGNVYYYW